MSDKYLEVGPRLYLNGFPKSGTHILVTMAVGMLKKVSREHNWLGNLTGQSFKAEIANVDKVLKVINAWDASVFLKGHMAYDPKIAEAFVENSVAKAFIFRDFRDVAVSAAYHAQRENGVFPEKEFYQDLPFDECLKRIITGDEIIDGVMDRWELFAPWLEEDWVLKLCFEDYIEHRQEVIGLFIRYVYGKTARYQGLNVTLDKDDYETMVDHIASITDRSPDISPTYRKAQSGQWKSHFTEEHKELFKETDKNNWLMRLGYAEDRDW